MFPIDSTTTASTFKSVFILPGMCKSFRMYKFHPRYVLSRRRNYRDSTSTKQHGEALGAIVTSRRPEAAQWRAESSELLSQAASGLEQSAAT